MHLENFDMRSKNLALKREIQTIIDSTGDPYCVKENYISRHVNLDWWHGHLNYVIFKETYSLMGDIIGDFGCNHGLNTILLSQIASNSNIIGIDMNRLAIDKAIENVSMYGATNTNFFCSRLEKMSFICDNYFTGGYMMDVLEHIYTKDRIKLFNELKRVMRKDSKLMIITPYGKNDNVHHVDFFNEKKLKQIVLMNNFEILYCQHDLRYNLRGKKQNRLNILIKINKD